MRWRGYGLVSEVESGDGRPCTVVDGFDGDVHADSVCTARKDANNALGVVDGRTATKEEIGLLMTKSVEREDSNE